MRTRLALLLAAALPLGTVGCSATTQHTGKRPMATRRQADPEPVKPLEQRVIEYEQRRSEAEKEAARAVAASEQRIGVGSTHVFHFPSCAALKDVPREDRVIFVSAFDALDGGFAPCDDCHPGP